LAGTSNPDMIANNQLSIMKRLFGDGGLRQQFETGMSDGRVLGGHEMERLAEEIADLNGAFAENNQALELVKNGLYTSAQAQQRLAEIQKRAEMQGKGIRDLAFGCQAEMRELDRR